MSMPRGPGSCNGLWTRQFLKNSCVKELLWHARTKSAPRGCQALGLLHFHCKFSRERALVEILPTSSLRGPGMILYRSLTDLLGILAPSSLRGACKCHVSGVFVWKLCLYQALVRSAPAAALYEDLAQGFVQFLVRRPCGDPSEMLTEASAWSCTGPCEKLLKRSWRNVLTWSRPGPRESCMKIWWAPLYIDLHRRSCCCSCELMPNLMYYCSKATVACIWYTHWLPTPHTVWGLLPV